MREIGIVSGVMPLELEFVACQLCGNDRPSRFWQGPDSEYRHVHTEIGDLPVDEFRFVQCGACSHVYLSPRPLALELAKIYDVERYYAYEAYSDTPLTRFYKRRNRGFYASALAALPAPDGVRRIVDIGCGSGFKLDVLADAIGPPCETHAVEMSAALVAELRRRGHVGHIGGYDAASIPKHGFDLVSASHVIEHVIDPHHFVATLASYARPGGIIVIDTPNRDSVDGRLFRHYTWEPFAVPQHLHLFNKAVLERVVRACGLEVVAVTFQPSAGIWLMSLHDSLELRGYHRLAARVPGRKLKRQRASAWDVGMLAAFTVVDAAARKISGQGPDMRLVARRPLTPRRAGIGS